MPDHPAAAPRAAHRPVPDPTPAVRRPRPGRRLAATLLAAALAACGPASDGTPAGGGRVPKGGGPLPHAGEATSLAGDTAEAARARLDAAAARRAERGTDVAGPPTARRDMLDGLREALAAPRSPADGGGAVRVLEARPLGGGDDGGPVRPVPASSPGRWSFAYTAGAHGIVDGGMIVLQVSPFWEWSQPWVASPDDPEAARAMRPGLTEVRTEADGVDLEVIAVEMGVAVLVGGRALAEGEEVLFTYGAGEAGARADRYAERETPFWFSVDGDGDGIPGLVEEPARVDIAAGPPARLVATLTSCASPGDTARLTLAVLDPRGSRGTDFTGSLRFVDPPEALEGLPGEVTFAPADAGVRALEVVPRDEGVYRLVLEGPDGLQALTNPLVVLEGLEPVLWADLHGHSHVSDGTGTPGDYYRYARDVAALDVVALTDHDHWGFRKLDADPETWQHIKDTVADLHEPGRFVALLGYEWTSWLHGHRHVLSFDEQQELEVLSSVDPDYETPRQLWDALRGEPVLTFAHHSAGGPIATNWSYRPDPVIEPVTEIVSVHGSSEAMDSPHRIYDPRPGNFVRDILDEGMRFGFLGSGDSHDGHPGLSHLANPTGAGGLAAVLTGDLTRDGVLDALRRRRVYATSGARIVLRASLDGHRMGETFPAAGAAGELAVLVYGTTPIQAVELIRSGEVVDTWAPEESYVFDLGHSWELPDLGPGEYVYVRVVQLDGHTAWGSPFYLE